MPGRLFTDEQEREIAAAYARGDRSGEIAKTWGCTRETVANVVRRQGGTVHPPKFRASSQRVALPVDEIEANWGTGKSATELAALYGVNAWTIRARLRERGITTERRTSGERHPKWSGGRHMMTNGYVRIWVSSDDPMAAMRGRDGYVYEHRIVMARSLGRPLTQTESVHHRDGDRANNALENLQLRQRHHGNGQKQVCLDCGSHNVRATDL